MAKQMNETMLNLNRSIITEEAKVTEMLRTVRRLESRIEYMEKEIKVMKAMRIARSPIKVPSTSGQQAGGHSIQLISDSSQNDNGTTGNTPAIIVLL